MTTGMFAGSHEVPGIEDPQNAAGFEYGTAPCEKGKAGVYGYRA
jgi:hypothetical protein